MYEEGTKFELHHFDGPDEMHRVALSLGIALTWHTKGDANKPKKYTESFDIHDSVYPDDPEKNKKGLSRRECEEIIYNAYCKQMYE